MRVDGVLHNLDRSRRDFASGLDSEYTAIGDVVNVASRLEALTKEHGTPVLVSETTRAAIQGPVRFIRAPDMPIRGRAAPLSVFVPSYDPEAAELQGIWLKDHESIAAMARAADSTLSGRVDRLRTGDFTAWVAQKDAPADSRSG